jgi:hypothetical protein
MNSHTASRNHDHQAQKHQWIHLDVNDCSLTALKEICQQNLRLF